MRYLLITFFALGIIVSLILGGCDSQDYSYLTKYRNDQPNNNDDNRMPPLQYNNITGSFSATLGDDGRTVRLNVSGVINPNTGEPIDLVRNKRHVFVVEDGEVKNYTITKVDSTNILPVDLVFTVDNSGSMGGEADSVATGIIAFARELESKGLDVRFGCVGFSGRVTGALNFTTADSLELFLNFRNGHPVFGTSRTRGFAGPDSASLRSAANTFASGVWGENGVVAVFFADSMFAWKPGAQRQFINFTDEPTQPGGIFEWSTEHLCNVFGGQIGIHTVFSADSSWYSWSSLHYERPWKMSECTGGTVEFISGDASDLDLADLPIVSVLENSYLIEFRTNSPDGTHTVQIFIFDTDADGMLELKDIKYTSGSGGP